MGESTCVSYSEQLSILEGTRPLSVSFDLMKAYDERRQQYSVGRLIVRTSNVMQSAVVTRKGSGRR